jgi:hypothetical protein
MSDDKCSDSFSISIALPCFWIDSTCYVFTLALDVGPVAIEQNEMKGT